MKIKVIIHDAEEGSYWAEVPAIPGCATEGETFEDPRTKPPGAPLEGIAWAARSRS